MHHRTAAFLADYAERGRLSRSRLPFAGIAARALAAAVRRGDREAAEAAWQAWLRHPDDQTWDLLCGPRGEQAMDEAVFAAATDPARDAVARAALGIFCARRGLAPAAGPGQVLFYLLSGQPAQRRAADPDGSALAAAYRAADEPVRAAVREAMAGDGSADLVRVVAARDADLPPGGGPAVPGSVTERDYLAAELARRQDWPQLWRLALDLPLAEAVAAAQRLPPDWPPGGAAAGRLRTRLAAVSPAAITALATAETVTHLDPRDPGYALHGLGPADAPYNRRVADCEFAPDGSQVAVLSDYREGSWQRDFQANLCALPGGRPLELIPGTRSLLFVGRAVVYVTEPRRGREPHLYRQVRGHAVEDLGPSQTHWWRIRCPWLVPVPDGFVLTEPSRLRHGTAVPGSPLRDITPASLREVVPAGVPPCWIEYVAAEPRTGRLAVAVAFFWAGNRIGEPEVLLLSPDGEVTGRINGAGSTRQLAFCGPDRLITLQADNRVRSWRVTSPEVAGAVFDARPGPYAGNPRIYPLPSAGLVLAGPDCLDAATLQPTAWPSALDWMRERESLPWEVSPDGGNAVRAGDRDILEIRDLWRQEAGELLRKPMARLWPADLAAVARLDGDFPARHAAAPGALGLLRACLEYRFGAEVAIGTGPAAGAQDDIALAERDRTDR